MDWREHISIDSDVLAGKPVVTGTRLSVSLIVGKLAQGWTFDDLLDSYPRLTEQDIRACLAYAEEILEQESVFPRAG